MKTLYTAEVIVEGGRDGRARSIDGRLDLNLSVPTEMGGFGGPGTNPEQLFAAGYAACYHSALQNVAAGRKLNLEASSVTAKVGLGPTEGGKYGLSVSLDLHAPYLDPDDAPAVMLRAHDICPYSNATRGNVEVLLKFDGSPVQLAPVKSVVQPVS